MSQSNPKRMITCFDGSGVNLGSVAARRGEETPYLPNGTASWKEGAHEGNLNVATNRVNKRTAAPVRRSANRLSGIPDGAKVLVNGERHEPVDGVLDLDVDSDEDVRVDILHDRHEHTTVMVACSPRSNRGGAAVDQDYRRLRLIGYDKVASVPDQLDALWKLLPPVIDMLTPEQRATLDQSALAVMSGMADVKTRVPKKGPAK